MATYVKIKINTNSTAVKVKVDQGIKMMKIAVVEQLLNYSLPFVPKADNTLRDSGFAHSIPEKGLAIWDTPYAKYQWYGMWEDGSHVVKNYTTPGTGTMWADKAAKKYRKELNKTAQNLSLIHI